MKRAATIALGTLLLQLPISPATAVPPPPPSFSRYGPLVQCTDGYQVTVSNSEAIRLQMGTLLVSDDFRIFLDPGPGAQIPDGARLSEINVPHLGPITRVRVPPHRGVPGLSDPAPARFEYRLPATGEGRPVRLWSDRFDGSERDLELLARVTRVDSAAEACGQFDAPDYAGADPDAEFWSPTLHSGRPFRCLDKIGFAVRENERLQFTWRFDGNFRRWTRVVSPEGRLFVQAPERVSARTESGTPRNSGYLETVQSRPDGTFMLIMVPPDREGRPLSPGESFDRQIRIDFEAGGEAAARELAGRLEFIRPSDPRCA